jgi:hypothetical protein
VEETHILPNGAIVRLPEPNDWIGYDLRVPYVAESPAVNLSDESTPLPPLRGQIFPFVQFFQRRTRSGYLFWTTSR